MRGAAMGAEALRIAGLASALEGLGFIVEDSGDLSGPANPGNRPQKGYRHLPQCRAWCKTLMDAVSGALQDGCFPILLGGDHSLSIGSVAGAARFCQKASKPLTILWLDAHADFNTPRSSPSGNLHGMPASIITGHGPHQLCNLAGFAPLIHPSNMVQVGVRSIDAIEKRLVAKSGLVIHDMRSIDQYGMGAIMEQALAQVGKDEGHLHVSLDIDFLDPAIAPGVATAVLGGPTYREAQLCMEMISDCGRMASLDIMEINPIFDQDNKTARLAVSLIKSLFGEQTLARTPQREYP